MAYSTLSEQIVASVGTGEDPAELLGLASVAPGEQVASGVQAAHITDASTAHSLNATFSNTEVQNALNALGVKINSILLVLEGYKQTATS